MKFSLLTLALLPSTLAYIGEICGNSKTGTGTCEKNSWCNSRHGTHDVKNLCPNDPDDVMCCFDPNCDSDKGVCMDTTAPNASFNCHHMDGTFKRGFCPGPDTYLCCVISGDSV